MKIFLNMKFVLLILVTFGVAYTAKYIFIKTSNTKTSTKIYKLIPASNYNASAQENCIILTELDLKSGFIHTAYEHQIQAILKKFFKSLGKILAIELDPNILKAHNVKLKPESNKPGGEIFPHLYGEQKIPQQAVTKVIEYKEQPDGSWSAVPHQSTSAAAFPADNFKPSHA